MTPYQNSLKCVESSGENFKAISCFVRLIFKIFEILIGIHMDPVDNKGLMCLRPLLLFHLFSTLSCRLLSCLFSCISVTCFFCMLSTLWSYLFNYLFPFLLFTLYVVCYLCFSLDLALPVSYLINACYLTFSVFCPLLVTFAVALPIYPLVVLPGVFPVSFPNHWLLPFPVVVPIPVHSILNFMFPLLLSNQLFCI